MDAASPTARAAGSSARSSRRRVCIRWHTGAWSCGRMRSGRSSSSTPGTGEPSRSRRQRPNPLRCRRSLRHPCRVVASGLPARSSTLGSLFGREERQRFNGASSQRCSGGSRDSSWPQSPSGTGREAAATVSPTRSGRLMPTTVEENRESRRENCKGGGREVSAVLDACAAHRRLPRGSPAAPAGGRGWSAPPPRTGQDAASVHRGIEDSHAAVEGPRR